MRWLLLLLLLSTQMGLMTYRKARMATALAMSSTNQQSNSRDEMLQQILNEQGVSMQDLLELRGVLMDSNCATDNDRQLSLQSLGIDKSMLKDIPGQSIEQDKALEEKKIANRLKSEAIKEAKKQLKEKSLNHDKNFDESNKKGLSNASTSLKRTIEVAPIPRSEVPYDKEVLRTKFATYRKDPTAFGVTLENMIHYLIEEKGYAYIYDRTDIKIFSEPLNGKRPSINSILQLLRSPDMLWARKKVESLYRSSQKKVT